MTRTADEPTHGQPPHTTTAADRLEAVYRRPGPYTTVYLARDAADTDSATDAGAGGTLDVTRPEVAERWTELRRSLEGQSAPKAALDAIDARLKLPAPADVAATGLIAAADGTTIVEHGLEPPVHDYGVVDTLPHAGPLLEWHQRRVPHLVATIDDSGADVALFGLDHYQELTEVDATGAELADEIAARAKPIAAELIVLAGDRAMVSPIAERLGDILPAPCRIVTEPLSLGADELADATVRHVADTAARTTVGHLRQRRFLAEHQTAVDGGAATLKALANGTAEHLLVHDDPTDQRRCWIGPEPDDVSLTPHTGFHQARLVDAAIRSAVLQRVPIHIIPMTGSSGPAEDTAAITSPPEPALAGFDGTT